MSYSPIAFIAPNYRDYPNYWLKAYEPATTTTKPIALDSNGDVQVAKLQLNADGFFVSAGQAISMPYIDGRYDAYLFPTETEADSNDTSNAIRVADDILGVNGETSAADIMTLQQAIENTSAQEGDYVRISDRAYGLFKYDPEQVPNGLDVIDVDAAGVDLFLIVEDGFSPRNLGAVYDGVASDTLAINRYYETLQQIASEDEGADIDETIVIGGEKGNDINSWSGDVGVADVMYVLGDNQSLESLDVRTKSSMSSVTNIEGKGCKIKDVNFKVEGLDALENHLGNCAFLREGSENTLITENVFENTRYNIIQATGDKTEKVIINNNFSLDSINDFVLQNNDTDNGLSHSWLVSSNIVDQTNSSEIYGTTECRGIGFTSVYGGMAINNAMIAVRGDAATHLENFQESMFSFNYYRDCWVDVLFSGLTNRRLIRLSSNLSINIGDIITDTITGATGRVQFWLYEGDIVQVINISGSFSEGNAFTTSGGASGTIEHVDVVQSHTNHIGNVYHKTNDDTITSTSLGSYRLRNYLSFNTYNNQGSRGNKRAISTSVRPETTILGNSFRGWDRAINTGGGQTGYTDLAFNKYWGNVENLYTTSATIRNTWFKERFYDGAFNAFDLQKCRIESCEFDAGEININSTTNDNVWRDNIVSDDVILTSLSVLDFNVWESLNFSKKGSCNAVRRQSITPSSGTPTVLATLDPRAGETSVIVESSISFRNSGANRYGAGSEKMQITWSPVEVPVITLDPNNFNPDGGVTVTAVDVGSGLIELRAVADTASGWIADLDVKIIESGVDVVPAKFIDNL